MNVYTNVLTELTHAEVEEETIKAEIRKQYEFNYLDGCKTLGVKLVERIFPALASRAKSIVTEEPAKQNAVV